MFGWLNPQKEKNRLIVEVSNDAGDAYVIDVPHSRKSEQVITDLTDAGIGRDSIHDRPERPERKRQILEARDSEEYRWEADESVDMDEDLEDNGDYEPDDFREYDYCDDEESEQDAVRFWPFW